ncbi:MAG: PIN domain-containing protein [Candidatus Micrarchaeota archaeon]|nr:PIN domain-containing protein [Candidatus Micrarchaeota archaeon]
MRDDHGVVFDTTTIVYAYDQTEPKKRSVCERLLSRVYEGKLLGVVTNQILAETFNVLTTKMGKNMPKEKAEETVNELISSSNWKKLNYTSTTVKNAISTSNRHGSPFWDTLIAETMLENGLSSIVTENEEDFKKVPGISVINPFKQKSWFGAFKGIGPMTREEELDEQSPD